MATSAIQAVLFDKDGTLLDFNATWASVYQHAAEQVVPKADIALGVLAVPLNH